MEHDKECFFNTLQNVLIRHQTDGTNDNKQTEVWLIIEELKVLC